MPGRISSESIGSIGIRFNGSRRRERWRATLRRQFVKPCVIRVKPSRYWPSTCRQGCVAMESLSPHSRPVKLPIEASPHRAALATAFNYSQTAASYFIGRRRLPSFDRPRVSSPALRKNLPSRAILRGKGRPGWTRPAVHRFSNSSTIFRYYSIHWLAKAFERLQKPFMNVRWSVYFNVVLCLEGYVLI